MQITKVKEEKGYDQKGSKYFVQAQSQGFSHNVVQVKFKASIESTFKIT